ncbi:MAG: hypothetical protein ACX94D_11830 [Henriciella sp.]
MTIFWKAFTGLALYLGMTDLAGAQTREEIVNALSDKGYALVEILEQKGTTTLVRATTQPRTRRPQERLVALHDIDPTAPLFTPEDVNSDGTVDFPTTRTLVSMAAITSLFRATGGTVGNCPAGDWYSEKPQGPGFVYNYLLDWTFDAKTRDDTEPELFLTRLTNRARPYSLPQPGLKSWQRCRLRPELEIDTHVVHKPNQTNGAKICVARYTSGWAGNLQLADSLSLSEAAAKCPGGAALADAPLEAYGIYDAELVADEPDIAVYKTYLNARTTFVFIHKLDRDTPIGIYEEAVDGTFKISQAFEQRLNNWSVFPTLEPDQVNQSVNGLHYVDGYTPGFRPGVRRPAYAILGTTHRAYADEGQISHPTYTPFNLPPLSANAFERQRMNPKAEMDPAWANLPGQTPESVQFAIERPLGWPRVDMVVSNLPPNSALRQRAERYLSSADLNLSMDLISYFGVTRMVEGLSFVDCKSGDEACRERSCRTNYNATVHNYMIGKRGKPSRDDIISALRETQEQSFQVEDGGYSHAEAQVRSGCLGFMRDRLVSSQQPGTDAFGMDNEQGLNVLIAYSRNEPDNDRVVAATAAWMMRFSFGARQLRNVASWIPEEKRDEYAAILEAYSNFYDRFELTEALALSDREPVLLDPGLDLTQLFRSGGQTYTYADALDVYKAWASARGKDSFNNWTNEAPIAFYDDTKTVYVIGYDPRTRWFGIDTYSSAQASAKHNGEPVSLLLSKAMSFQTLRDIVR